MLCRKIYKFLVTLIHLCTDLYFMYVSNFWYLSVINFSVFWSFFNHCQKVSQVRNNVVCVVACLVFVSCCALTTGCCNAFQHVFINQKKSEFYDPCLQTMLYRVTMWDFNFLLPNFNLIEKWLCLSISTLKKLHWNSNDADHGCFTEKLFLVKPQDWPGV